MTDDEKFMEVIKSIGELIKEKDRTIYLQNYEINSLKDKLAEAEKQIEELQKGNTNE